MNVVYRYMCIMVFHEKTQPMVGMRSWNWKSEVEGEDSIEIEKGVMWQPCRTLGFINIIK